MFAESKDEVALLLLGTPGSANRMNYDNITEERPFKVADLDLIQHVKNNVQPSQVSGDCILILTSVFRIDLPLITSKHTTSMSVH